MPKNKNNYRDSKWLSNAITKLKEFTAEPAQKDANKDVPKELSIECEKPFKKGKYQSVYGLIELRLGWLSSQFLREGAIAVLNGDIGGWNELRRGLLYDSWAARLRHAVIIRDNCYDHPQIPSSASIFEGTEALTLCHAIATGDNEFAHAFGNHLLGNFQKTNGSDKIYFYTMPFFPFVLKLYSIWVGKKIEFRLDVADPLKRYQQVFDHWESPSDLAVCLLDICDLHCEEAVDKEGYPAFSYYPYSLFPVEIMSIFRIRQQLGLETPQVDHPLLKSPLLSPPKKIPVVKDALLERVIARFRSDLPDVTDFC